jgi:hypothetical protein
MYKKYVESWYLASSESGELVSLLNSEIRKHASTGETQAIVFRSFSIDSSFEVRMEIRFGWSGILMSMASYDLKNDGQMTLSSSMKLTLDQESIFKIAGVLEFFGIDSIELIQIVSGRPQDSF